MLMTPVLPDTAPTPPRAIGAGRLSVRCDGGLSRLARLHQSGSLKLLFPRVDGPILHAVTLNTAGGVTGGDRFSLEAVAGAGARLALTTQAAERIYRALPGQTGRVETSLSVEENATLHWLPQETILFDGAALDRRLTIRAHSSARVLAVETLVFGRQAMGERVSRLLLRDRLDLSVDDRLVFADRLRLDGDAEATLARAAVANGARAMASVLVSAPDAAANLPHLRPLVEAGGGVSALTNDLLFLRLLAPDSFDLRAALVPILRHLSGAELPRTWMI